MTNRPTGGRGGTPLSRSVHPSRESVSRNGVQATHIYRCPPLQDDAGVREKQGNDGQEGDGEKAFHPIRGKGDVTGGGMIHCGTDI